MADVEHIIAVYWDVNGVRRTIHFEELADDDTFADAKGFELYDESEQVRVFPRDRSVGRRHFFSESVVQRRFDRGENDPAHNARVDSILGALEKLDDGWSLAYQSVAATPPVTQFGPLPRYVWGAEVTRILNQDTSVRHDVFGDWGIRMSTRLPSIAIEVVNSHFPAEQTFAALVKKSLETPLVVLFDFTWVSRNKILVVDEKSQKLIFRSYTFSIYDGTLWEGDVPCPGINTADRFEVAARRRYDGWT